MLAADADEAMRLRAEAYLLALKLNGGNAGILSHDDAPGHVLAGRTAAAPGTVPRWGQTGDFIVMAGRMQVRVELDAWRASSSLTMWLFLGAFARFW